MQVHPEKGLSVKWLWGAFVAGLAGYAIVNQAEALLGTAGWAAVMAAGVILFGRLCLADRRHHR